MSADEKPPSTETEAPSVVSESPAASLDVLKSDEAGQENTLPSGENSNNEESPADSSDSKVENGNVDQIAPVSQVPPVTLETPVADSALVVDGSSIPTEVVVAPEVSAPPSGPLTWAQRASQSSIANQAKDSASQNESGNRARVSKTPAGQSTSNSTQSAGGASGSGDASAANGSSDPKQYMSLHLKVIPDGVTAEQIKQFFAPFGEIKNIR